MQKIIGALTALVFTLWILPLGVFIKPSDEKLACDGQRAICLCSHLLAKQQTKNSGQLIYKGSSSSQKEKNNSAGSGHNFLFVKINNQIIKSTSTYLNQQSSFYSLLIDRSVDYVPKA